MIDETEAIIALRARATATVVATTGSVTLAATATGYARSSGSFLTDGFRPGMEVTPAGFSANTVDVITGVSATELRTEDTHPTESASSGRTLSVGLPALRAWEQVGSAGKKSAFERVSGRPYIEEAFVPATSRIITFPANGGAVEETGLYVLRWFGPTGYGSSAIRDAVGALKARFSAGTALTLLDGSVVRVRADTGPYTGQLRRLDGGWSVLTLTIPWLARSTNAVAA